MKSSTESPLEKPPVIRTGSELVDHETDRGIAHFIRGQQRPPHLLLQTVFPAIVKQQSGVGHVVEAGRVAADAASLDAHRRFHFIVGKALFWNMAEGAGYGVVQGQPAVVEQLAAQGDFGGGQWIVSGNRYGGQSRLGLFRKLQQGSRLTLALRQGLGVGGVVGCFVVLPIITWPQVHGLMRDEWAGGLNSR